MGIPEDNFEYKRELTCVPGRIVRIEILEYSWEKLGNAWYSGLSIFFRCTSTIYKQYFFLKFEHFS